jgi:REP element-mobilizing transposase RayT
MSRAHKFKNPEGLYFITFATVGWVDVFTRTEYKKIMLDSITNCQKEKGLLLFAWCFHLIAKTKDGFALPAIMRDLKKYTSKQILNAIEETNKRAGKSGCFHYLKNRENLTVTIRNFNFGNKITGL